MLHRGQVSETYNIGSDEEYSNMEVMPLICQHFGLGSERTIEFVADRPFNDTRYAIDSSKIHSLGWSRRRSLRKYMGRLTTWYAANRQRFVEYFGTEQERHT